MSKNIKVRSINNVKHDGKWHLPGTTWECPAADARRLIKLGTIEPYTAPPMDDDEDAPLLEVAEMKKKEIVAELKHRNALFDESEGVDALREVLSMARESQDQ